MQDPQMDNPSQSKEHAPHYLRQELYRQVRENSEIFDFLQQGSLDGIWYWDLENPEHEWLSPEFWHLLGYDPSTKLHQASAWQDLIDQDDLATALKNFEKHIADPNYPYDQVVRYRHKDGSTVWVRCRGVAIRDDNGKAYRMLGAHTDITALKESEADFRRFERMFNATQDLVAFVDRDYYYRAVNLSYQNAWRLPRESFVGRTVSQVMGEAVFRKAVKKHLDHCLAGEVVSYQQWFDFPGLGYRLMQATYEPSRDEKNEVEGCVVNVRDITQHHRDKQKIIDQAEVLQKSNRDLASFAYVASHDLKSPLRAIRHLSTWIKEDLGEVPDRVEEHLTTMEGRISRMESLLDDLLNYSQIGRSESKVQAFESKVCCEEMLEMSAATDSFSLHLHGDFPAIHGLKVPFEQVMRNLISNSVKHHDREGGRIDIFAEDSEDFHIFYLCDDGPGVAEEFHEKIFGMFQTLKPRDQIEGSGMGLATVRKICESVGGQVTVSTAPTAWKSSGDKRGLCIKVQWPKTMQKQ